ncbi:MAG: hypothetical protein ACYC0J_00775 [Gammaproteobacteria bacterium]
MAKIHCVLYNDPVGGYLQSYTSNNTPEFKRYPRRQLLPKFLDVQSHTVIITSDKADPDSCFEKELPDADVVISQPFWSAYLIVEHSAHSCSAGCKPLKKKQSLNRENLSTTKIRDR